ncbi:hypothetical protein [Rathayibacter sp. AY1G1]|uniref:hypothetical protein n=1 Tax=Rathayibacter sp. AY1G1 TaxID=2080564 RepID=UPI0011B0B78D|nr:hypothetical protein [Rathayibacter sp. AY1G1]
MNERRDTEPEKKARVAGRKVTGLRNELLHAQEASLELAKLGVTEFARLDNRDYRASVIAERLGIKSENRSIAPALYSALEDLNNSLAKLPESLSATTEVKEGSPTSARDRSQDGSISIPAPEGFADALRRIHSILAEASMPPRMEGEAIEQYSRIKRSRSRSDMMLESLFVSSIAEFEIFIARLVAIGLGYNPAPLYQGGKSYELAEIRKHETIESLVANAIDDKVDDLMRDGLSAWMKYLQKILRAETDWMTNLLIEVFNRRHVLVHAGGRVSRQYIDSVRHIEPTVVLNSRLEVSFAYLEDSQNRLLIVAIALTQLARVAIANSPEGKKADKFRPDEDFTKFTYDLLRFGRSDVVADLFPRIDSLLTESVTIEYSRANWFHARKMRDGVAAVRKDVEAWDVSAMDELLVLARLCILEDLDDARRLATSLSKKGKLSPTQFLTWPILEPLRRAKSLVV